MIQAANMVRVFETLLHHKAICCVCQKRPQQIIVDQFVADGLRVGFICHGPRSGMKINYYRVSVPGDFIESIRLDPERLYASRIWWELTHPFPRSLARHGKVSAAARRERRVRLAGRDRAIPGQCPWWRARKAARR